MTETEAAEEARLEALRSYGILDTPTEADFDHLTSLAARFLDVPIALVSLVDRDRQWFKSSFGLDGIRETPRELAFCDHAMRGSGVMVVPDATADPRFASNALVTGEPGIRFYAGAPLVTPEGQPLGTLCIIDRRPHPGLSERDLAMLTELAGFVRGKLELRRELHRSQALAAQAALIRRLMTAAAEAPDFAAAIEAAAVAIREATGALFCHVWRLAADGTSALFVTGAGQGLLGEEAHFTKLRAMRLTPANSQVAEALVEQRQTWGGTAPGPETALRPAAALAGQAGVKFQLATPFGFGAERYVYSVGLGQAPDERDAMATLLREATTALHPMLRRHMDEADGRLFRRMIETSANGVLVSEPPFEEPGPHLIFANAAFEHMSGYSLAEIKGRSPRFIFGPESDPETRARITADIMAGRSVTEEVLQYRKDGTTYWTSLRITPVPDSAGTVTHYISSQSDITQARQARLERDALTRDLQTLVAAIPGVLMRHRPRTGVFWDRTFIAPGVEALTGYTVEEARILGWWLAGTSEHDQHKLYAALNDALGGGQSRTDFRFRRKDGVLIWIRILMRGNVAPDGEREVISIWSDISEEYRMAAEREAKTRELETVMATIPGVIIRTRREPDGSWKRIQVARSITELTGHSVEEAMAEDWWPANAEPGSVLRAKAFFQSENVMAPWEGEFQFRHKLGHWIWIRRRSRGYVDEHGAEELVSIWNDVTAQKNLLLEREKLTADLQSVITTMPGVMMRIHKNEEGRWFRHFVSPSVEALTGFTVEEAQRADWLPNNLDPADRASMLALLAEGDPLAPETTYFRFRHKQGHILWIMRNTSGYLDAAGRVEVISIWNDITAEKSLALERERLAADLQRVITTMPGVLIHAQKDADGRWVRRFISPAIEALTGFTVEEAHAADWWSNGIDPQDRDRMMTMMYQGDLSEPTATDFRFRHKQGHTIWIRRNTRGFLGLDGQPEAISIWNDITAEKRLLLDQEAMANDLQRVINTMPGILVRLRQDSAGNWVCHFISPAIEALTGFTVAETKRPNWWLDNLDPSERERLPALLYQTDMAEQKPITFHFRHKQGHSIWINRTTSAYRDADGQPEVISVWSDITAERRLLLDREELASDLQAVIKVMPGGLMRSRLRRDQTWLRYFVSAGMEVMTGYTITEMKQSDWARATLHPDDRPALAASLTSEAAGLPTTLEFRLRHKLGHYIWINRRTSSFTNAEGEVELVAIWTDVTAERQLLADRDELASDLQAVMDAMPGVLMRIRNGGDRWDRIHVGPGIEALTGHSVAEAMHPEWLEENLDPAERGLLVGQMRGQFTEHQLSVEFRFRHKKGHWIWIRRIARGHLDPDGTREVIAIWNDVTREKSLTEQLAQSAKLAQLGEMATGMAHELNQPLAGISMAAENAQRSLARLPEPVPRAQEKLALIVDLTKRASDIIEHMRIFGRTETAGREPVSLAEVVTGAQTLLANKLHAAGVRLEVSLPTGLPPVLGKPVPLEQVLMNLIGNACDAYAGLAQPVPAERRLIQISAHAEGEWVTIEVQDAAGGIPEEVMPRIFEPFFTTKPVGQGTGLGLSISYGIIRDMGGTITAENHAQGCLMRILLPVAR